MHTQDLLPEVVVIGTAFLDVKGVRPQVRTGLKAVGTVRLNHGGVGRNVAENLGWLGVRVGMITLTAQDATHQLLQERLARAGVQTASLPVESGVGWFVSIHDEEGRLLASAAAPPAVEHLSLAWLTASQHWLTNCKILVAELGLSEPLLESVIATARQQGTLVVGLPTRLNIVGPRWPLLRQLDCLILNHHEAGQILGREITSPLEAQSAAQDLCSEGIDQVIITLGADGAVRSNRDSPSVYLPAVAVPVVDSVGAGDALAAGVVAGLSRGVPLSHALTLGMQMGSRAVASADTVRPEPASDLLTHCLEEYRNGLRNREEGLRV
jgi:pseudouridine kinase